MHSFTLGLGSTRVRSLSDPISFMLAGNHVVQERLVDGSVVCETSAKKLVAALCTGSSSQLLAHIHSVYNIENVFE